ncbi:DUF4262 domain-containing protein [Pseudobythopirellula maris]|uniref:DUF4262 domain-containing protein n=1 Tax=Pseudobythopirellula maris TaxID=2527991 RepID=UPI0011B4C499|nr:DUF4262 domain-containing protein [Pseudobythopirellula maris]
MDEIVQKDVDAKGWTALSIFDGEPPFVYTAGLSKTFQHPEAIVFGLSPETASRLLSDFVDGLRSGLRFDQPGIYQDDVFASAVGIRAVHESKYELYLGYAMGFCRRNSVELSAVQLFWPDENGIFPFDAGCNEQAFELQPRLDIPLTLSECDEFRWMDDM